MLFPTPLLCPGKGLSVFGKSCLQGHPSTCNLSHWLSDQSNYKELLGAVDNAFLVAYAIGMFIR